MGFRSVSSSIILLCEGVEEQSFCEESYEEFGIDYVVVAAD